MLRRAVAISARQSTAGGYELPPLRGILISYQALLRDLGLTQAQVSERSGHLLRGEDVPALPATAVDASLPSSHDGPDHSKK